jgi:hypothetical protein
VSVCQYSGCMSFRQFRITYLKAKLPAHLPVCLHCPLTCTHPQTYFPTHFSLHNLPKTMFLIISYTYLTSPNLSILLFLILTLSPAHCHPSLSPFSHTHSLLTFHFITSPFFLLASSSQSHYLLYTLYLTRCPS